MSATLDAVDQAEKFPTVLIAESLGALDNESFERVYGEIMLLAKNHGFDGFGGYCAEAAVAINRVIFGDTGMYHAAFNKFFWENGHAVGHVVVYAREAYWDVDGHAKYDDDIETWGMLDREDPDWQRQAHKLGKRFTEKRASEVAFPDFESCNFDPAMFGCSGRLSEFEHILNEVALDRVRTLDAGRTLST